MNKFDFIKKCYEETFDGSPFKQFTSVNINSDESISFLSSGQKLLGFQQKKQQILVTVKNEYFKILNLDQLDIFYEISNIKSLSDFTRIIFNDNDFEKITKYLFQFSEKYVDEHYVPDYTFDCCAFYMQCSDARSCVNPDRIHAKSCTYREKLENGIIFFGENRNV